MLLFPQPRYLRPIVIIGICTAATLLPSLVSADSPAAPPIALSRVGQTGLIRSPSADVTPDGLYQIGFFGQVSTSGKLRFGDHEAFANAIGFLPQVEFNLSLSNPNSNDDLAVGGKAQIFREWRSRPALAVGIFDTKSTTVRQSQYIAASKHFLDGRLNGTIGYLTGGARGAYGGVEAGIIPHLSGVVEYDSKDVNYGVRTAFDHNYFQAGAMHLKEGWALQLGLQFPLSTVSKPPASVELPPTPPAEAAAALKTIQNQLVKIGLEDVTAQESTNAPRCVEISYDNRSFPHSEVDALANVLAAGADNAPADAVCVTAVAKRDNLPALQFSCPLSDYRNFMAGRMDAKTFKRSVKVKFTSAEAPPGPATAQTGEAASSYGRGDLILHPGVLTEIATENYLFGVDLLLQPELYLPIDRGIAISSFATIPLTGPLAARSNQPFLGSGLDNPHARLEQASIHETWRPDPRFVARVWGGRFPGMLQGAYSEALLLPGSGRFIGRLSGGSLQPVGSSQSQSTYVGEARYYFPSLNFEAAATTGKYLDGDTGETLALTRRFGYTDFSIEVRKTTNGKAGVVSFSVPIGPAHLSQRPSLLRIRPPDFFNYSQRSLLQTPNYVAIAAITGNQLEPADSLTRTFLDNDKMTPAYVLRSLPELRRVLPQVLGRRTSKG